MSQQLTLSTAAMMVDRQLSSAYGSMIHHHRHHHQMAPDLVNIKLCDRRFTVPSSVLCRSSRYFDALIRFNSDRTATAGSTGGGGGSVSSDIPEEIEIVENKLDEALKSVLINLMAIYNDCEPFTSPKSYQLLQINQKESLDFLFDCVLVCSKYFFDYMERLYSDQFVHKLRADASDCAVTDIILPPEYQDDENFDLSPECFLSMLQMHRLAQVYNLDYLSCGLNNLIRERRAIFLNRLRNTYYFW